MAKYGKFTLIVTNTSGDALSGISVEVRRQGATVNGTQVVTGSAAVTVDNPGATTSVDIVAQNTGTTTYQVSAVTATTITANWGVSNVTLTDDDRLTLTNSLVTLFADSNGNDTKINPLTTSSTGIATAWLTGGFYDVLVSGGSATTTLYQDVFIPAERVASTEFDSASAIVEILDTTRSLSTAGALLQTWRNNTTDKILFGWDGTITATGSGRYYGNLTASGIVTRGPAVVQGGGFTATGNSFVSGQLKANFFSGGIGVGEFTVTAAATTTVNDTDVAASSEVIIFPLNPAAGLLTRTKTCNVGTVGAGSFTFVVSATGAGAPDGTESFRYMFLRES